MRRGTKAGNIQPKWILLEKSRTLKVRSKSNFSLLFPHGYSFDSWNKWPCFLHKQTVAVSSFVPPWNFMAVPSLPVKGSCVLHKIHPLPPKLLVSRPNSPGFCRLNEPPVNWAETKSEATARQKGKNMLDRIPLTWFYHGKKAKGEKT